MVWFSPFTRQLDQTTPKIVFTLLRVFFIMIIAYRLFWESGDKKSSSFIKRSFITLIEFDTLKMEKRKKF